MQRSPYTGKPRGFASCVHLSMLCGEIKFRVDKRWRCGEGINRRANRALLGIKSSSSFKLKRASLRDTQATSAAMGLFWLPRVLPK